MSLFGAMNTAISGLSAQSNAFGNISDNVANSQTVGYKRVDTSFIDYLTTSTPSDNVPGAVVTRPDYRNSVQGTIVQSDRPLGLAIAGQGFFAVSQQAGLVNNVPIFKAQQFYTRAGDFQLDKNGFIANSAGQFINGWPVTGGVVNQNTLTPIQVSQAVYNPVATENVTLSANLPATPTPGAAFVAADAAVLTNASIIALAAEAAASRALAVAPTGQALIDANNLKSAADAAVSGTTAAVLGTAAGAAAAPALALAAINAAQAANFPATAPTSSAIDVYDALGTVHTVTLNWVQNSANKWTVQVSALDPDSTTANLGAADVTFGSGAVPTVQPGTVGDVTTNVLNPGTIPITTTAYADGGPATLTFFRDFGSGSQPITINLGTYGQTNGVTQYAGNDYSLRGLTQDGVPPGAFSSVTTQGNGDVAINYDNGQSRVIARIPVITFNNPNGLQRQDGQSFTVSQDSGGPLATTAGTNGAGNFVTESVEGSNVDIATEFSKLIVAQRAYSANTKIVTTSDDMLQQTIDMKR